MLELKNIVKTYKTGDTGVTALNGVSLSFRDSEFVSVLGPSGCGKTTLLNIIGGLDRYTSGDLVINGRSTKEFSDKDWDSYRNHSVGFVFQSYNLIPHQSVLANVELALTLSGVAKEERRRRAKEALEKVGLADQIKKRPNQLSGGQMQRVAIARALVNDPDILLADEPTGALDSDTSVQIMDLLREISRDKLIIMVTHNAELAERYSTRIVRLLDGEVVGDTLPPAEGEAAPERQARSGRTSMSFFTALSLSFNNLLTKKGRTFMTAFAGSIGIIGIALILAMSTGVQRYINDVQEETLSSYPIVLEAEQNDLGTMLSAFSEIRTAELSHERDAVYCNSQMYDMFNAVFSAEPTVNNLSDFKTYLDEKLASGEGIGELVSDVHYGYDVDINAFVKGEAGKYHPCEPAIISGGLAGTEGAVGFASMMGGRFSSYELWSEIMPGRNGEPVSEIISSQYELIYGRWPTEASDVVLIVDKNNEITDITFYALGLIPEENIDRIFAAAMTGEEIEPESPTVSYEDICKTTFKLLLNADLYADKNGSGVWEYIGGDAQMLELAVKNGFDLNIVGIIRPAEGARAAFLSGSFGYTAALTRRIIEETAVSGPVLAQKDPANANVDVLTGLPFVVTDDADLSEAGKADAALEKLAALSDEGKADLLAKIYAIPDEANVNAAVDAYMAQFQTRDDMVALAAQSYGMDAETAKTFLAAYSDEELAELIRGAVRDTILADLDGAAAERVMAVMTAPTEDELAAIAAGITARLPDAAAKSAYLAAKWTGETDIPAEAVYAYLAKLTPDALDAAVNAAAAEDAAKLYASTASADGPQAYAKAAAALDALAASADTATLADWYDRFMPSEVSGSSYAENLRALGVLDLAAPSSISLYADSFEKKDAISDYISEYNDSMENEDDRIVYTDYVALLMSGITTIIDAISYGLIVFVSVSLVVSSIMIGIITYVSVLERTKEIGILRAVGASKRDISRVFNAETLLVGFTAGILGIILSLILCIPINLIVHALAKINDINAYLPPVACVILVLISMGLTLLAGLIPSGVAARKDPVEALRTE
ncbi:MAG: ATP-binding cassette domain-containing protein [Oscillospiraceae bacterium]|nr:ATP-binding cassette domain-containing protein [Oscillospiraceae bacterium]